MSLPVIREAEGRAKSHLRVCRFDWMMGCWREDSADTDDRHRPAPRYTTRIEAGCGEEREAPGEQRVQPFL